MSKKQAINFLQNELEAWEALVNEYRNTGDLIALCDALDELENLQGWLSWVNTISNRVFKQWYKANHT